MESFFRENGNKNLLFFYGEPDPSHPSTPKTNIRGAKHKVLIVESSHLSLRGVCVFFVRNSTSIAITSNNISQVS
jgi:hypothetical protein